MRLWRVFSRVNLQSTDFELFDIPAQFAQERSVLDQRWKEIQREVHPDKFASEGAAAQRVAMQWSVRINEAYQRLKDPLKRAAYLCELNGAAVQADNNTAMPAAFLIQQMEWREALEEVKTVAALEALNNEIQDVRRETLSKCGQCLDDSKDYPGAVALVRALMFIERFAADIDKRMDQLDSAAA